MRQHHIGPSSHPYPPPLKSFPYSSPTNEPKEPSPSPTPSQSYPESIPFNLFHTRIYSAQLLLPLTSRHPPTTNTQQFPCANQPLQRNVAIIIILILSLTLHKHTLNPSHPHIRLPRPPSPGNITITELHKLP
ncbi:hypothetical protein P154DRAFT_134529 [Amniculicola lignicola CBS 123094]|uniref:Uncharacterized protein n=1 Tax=Amniculicola lignicola CBS 123094 TaxID=1392246 RepID=A0A6A5WME6_9PLEO|nr:hypothetical protein P154DRAFT_134529 [Amniculicola lignicola CBS 123094]